MIRAGALAFGTVSLLVFGATIAHAGNNIKVTICHFPPGDPSNYHTITVSEKALPAHLAHGDLIGGCVENCETLCDDGDPCTRDECDPSTGECLFEHPPVDCDDGLFCTLDSCDSVAGGCQHVEKECSDDDPCTVDFCSEGDSGACVYAPLCAPGDVCDPELGCLDPCQNVICSPKDQCHLAGICSGGVCDDPVAPDGTPCDDSNSATTNDQCIEGRCAGEGGGGPCGAGMVLIDDFCIDQWEAHILGHSPYEVPTGGTASTAEGYVPQGYISQVVAEAACSFAGKRLCTDAEWLRACQGPSGWTYPYGNDHIPEACNDFRDVHPVIEVCGDEPSCWSNLNDPALNQLADGLEPSGNRESCVSAEGVYDLVGNLAEWTADPTGTFRGGNYVESEINGNGCLNQTTAHNVEHHDFTTGFRCCRDY